MKPPVLLKTILDICFFLLICSLFSPLELLIHFQMNDSPLPIELNNRLITTFNYNTIILLIINYSITIIYVYIVYLLRKLVRSFFKNAYFTRLQISLFRLIGQLIILATISEFIMSLYTTLVLDKRIGFNFSIDGSHNNLFYTLAIGLFFIYLGKLFNKSKSLQEENELTV
ncbi:DUF2975 domain-containing protein [Gillisia sp. M10.2A]|uniref:DUF2975 domain-containing protein n=1 Tax=Gillisia lutea TaxID=2909668 RepID=A0ABS9EFB3_9FLAO|nr:DUF2975 domain-containing protein [Gillisia lutea]MCF4100470.1 DUF2975 domain-containing protein [Gillisia lutea]